MEKKRAYTQRETATATERKAIKSGDTFQSFWLKLSALALSLSLWKNAREHVACEPQTKRLQRITNSWTQTKTQQTMSAVMNVWHANAFLIINWKSSVGNISFKKSLGFIVKCNFIIYGKGDMTTVTANNKYIDKKSAITKCSTKMLLCLFSVYVRVRFFFRCTHFVHSKYGIRKSR